MIREEINAFYRETVRKRKKWNRRNAFYHLLQARYCSFIIPSGKKAIEIGCGSENLLNAVKPAFGTGIDFVPEVIDIVRFIH